MQSLELVQVVVVVVVAVIVLSTAALDCLMVDPLIQ